MIRLDFFFSFTETRCAWGVVAYRCREARMVYQPHGRRSARLGGFCCRDSRFSGVHTYFYGNWDHKVPLIKLSHVSKILSKKILWNTLNSKCFKISLIVNKAERKMKKGTGYHLDMFLIGSFEIFCGLLGLPMLCAATGQWLLSRYVYPKRFAEVHSVTTGVT